MTKKIFTTLVMSVCMLFVCGFAHAQETRLSPEEKERAREARELFDEGSAAFRAGETKKAEELLQRSFNLRESYDTAGNLGHVEMKLGLYAQAARHFEYCLRNFPTGENQKLKDSVEKVYAEVSNEVVTIKADVGPPGTKVTFGETLVGRAPIDHPLFGTPNTRYRLTLEGRNGETKATEVIGKAGQTLEITLNLDDTNARPPKIDSGLGNEGASDSELGTEVSDSRKRPSLVPAYILGGTTVAALGASVVFRSLSASNTNKMDDISAGLPSDGCAASGSAPSACNELKSLGDKANTQATIADVTLIAGGVLGAATIGYIIYALVKPSHSERVQATVLPQAGGGFLSLSGHF